MTAVADKILRSLQQVGVDSTLGSLIENFRIGVFGFDGSDCRAGLLLAEALGDTLGRLWHKIDVSGAIADVFVIAANAASRSCEGNACSRIAWAPPYDAVIVIGSGNPPGESPNVLHIGANGWEVTAGAEAIVGDDPNPVGPTAAAAIAAAEAFRIAFADNLGERSKRLPLNYRWSAWPGAERPLVGTITLPKVPIIGVGAVMHGLLWVFERWPADVAGQLDLVDPDSYGDSNGQRYAGMKNVDIGQKKVEQVGDKLQKSHPNLLVTAIPRSSNSYFEIDRPDKPAELVVVGVDSKEQRRQLGLKLPRRVVNLWTDGSVLGVGRHGIGDGWPCLYCAYPENKSDALDEAGQIYQETGILPSRARYLLDTSSPLEPQDIEVLRQRRPDIDANSLIGQAIRSVRVQICATSTVPMLDASEVDVPLAFVSFLCGVMGFVELIRELTASSEPCSWQVDGLKYPTDGCWRERAPTKGCYLCDDETSLSLVRRRFHRIAGDVAP
jgi:hypothetical protein